MKTTKDIIVYVDMDGVLCDFSGKHKEMLEKNPRVVYPQSQYGFFANLLPLRDAIIGYKWLAKHFNVHILTAPSYMNAMCYAEKRVWVEQYLGLEAAEKMIISGYKNLCQGDYLIDDNITGKGQDKFSGELIHFTKLTNDWIDIVKMLETRYKID